MSYNECSPKISGLKNEKMWLKEVNANSLIHLLRNLESEYDIFFNHISDFHRFNSKKNPVQSYHTQNVSKSVSIEYNHIRLSKIGFICYRTKNERLCYEEMVYRRIACYNYYCFFVAITQESYENAYCLI